jgi:CSLREA domain-containing protein
MRRLLRRYTSLVIAAALVLSAAAAQATILTVNKTADTNDGVCSATDCSLREAIGASASGDIIEFSSLFDTSQVITLTLGPLVINDDLTVIGPGAGLLAISGNYSARNVFDIGPPDRVVRHQIELRSLTIVGATGAGILHRRGALEVTSCNVALNRGSGIVSGKLSTWAVHDCGLTVTHSTITGNIGLYAGGIVNFGEMFLSNSTVSGNVGVSFVLGGAGGVINWDHADIRNCTITKNRVIPGSFGGSGGVADQSWVLNLNAHTYIGSSIIAGNIDNTSIPDVNGGTIFSQGYNLIGNVGSSTSFQTTGDQTGSSLSPIDPMLDPLADYGHGTLTHRLQAGSPAIDQGMTFFGEQFDQRYEPRTFQDFSIPDAVGGNGTDIGAYELQ